MEVELARLLRRRGVGNRVVIPVPVIVMVMLMVPLQIRLSWLVSD